MRRVILIVALLALTGCGRHEPIPEPVASPAPPVIRNPKIPAEVSYPIVSDEEEYNAFTKKRMVKVRVNMRVSAEVLREIALEVKATEKHQYERTYIFVVLPDDVPGAKNSTWATCHFNPTLDVTIYGVTKVAGRLWQRDSSDLERR